MSFSKHYSRSCCRRFSLKQIRAKTLSPNMKQVTIYCDGSSLGNGQLETRAAAVALLGYRGLWRAVGEYLGSATNQQAEVAAAAIADRKSVV